MNLFDRPIGCTCLDLTDRIRHELEGVPAPLCRVHDVEAISAAKRADAEREANDNLATLYAVSESLREPPPECSCPSIAEGLRAVLAGRDLDPCASHPPAPVESSSMALNGDPILRSLKAHLGISADPDPSGDDLPPAA